MGGRVTFVSGIRSVRSNSRRIDQAIPVARRVYETSASAVNMATAGSL